MLSSKLRRPMSAATETSRSMVGAAVGCLQEPALIRGVGGGASGSASDRRPMTGPLSRELALSTHCCPRRISERTTGLPRNLTFTGTAEQAGDDDSSHSRVATIARQEIPAERLHPKTAHSRCRPRRDIRCLDLVAPKPPVGPAHTHPVWAPNQRAHIGRRHKGRLRRSAGLETVRAHHFVSPACKPSAGSPSGRRMAPLPTTNATARNRPRCTAWCNSTPRPSSPGHRWPPG